MVTIELTTVNRSSGGMEALAAGLSAINCPAHVICNVHQSHVKAAINQGWWIMWRNCGWKNQKGRLVRDWELWREISELAEKKSLIISGGRDEFERPKI